MLIDLIAARPEDAEAILGTQGHANIWSTLESNTVDAAKLATLAFILQGKPLVAAELSAFAGSFERLADGGEEGPWMDLLPDSLVDDLAHLTDAQVDTVARAWAGTEAARQDRWAEADTASYLRELSAFAASAHAQQYALLLWTCP